MVAFLESPKIAYFGVHKAAGSSIKSALYDIEHGQAWGGSDAELHSKLHPSYPTRAVSQKDLDKAKDYWSFAVVRDPVKRFLSAYQNRVHDHCDLKMVADRQNSLLGRMNALLGRSGKYGFEGFKVAPTIEEFIADYDRYCAASYHMYIHTCSVSVFLGNDLSFLDRIYTISELDTLATDLSERAGRPITMPQKNPSASKAPKFEDLSQDAQAFLIQHTKQDYELLSDYFSPPQSLTQSKESAGVKPAAAKE